MKTAKKSLLLILCAIALVVTSVMGTIAYLSATASVNNTFAAKGLLKGDFVLTEHEVVRQDNGIYATVAETTNQNNYEVVPGVSMVKDPWVDFTLTEKAYLFLEVKDTLTYNAPDEMVDASLTWQINDSNWQMLVDKEGNPIKNGANQIYFCIAGNTAADGILGAKHHNYNIIKGDEVVAGKNFDTANVQEGDTLAFTGYLFQATGFADIQAAWNAAVIQFNIHPEIA